MTLGRQLHRPDLPTTGWRWCELRRRHGGRRARVRGLIRIAQDWRLLAGAVNLARLAVLGLRWDGEGWRVSPA